MTSFSKWDRDAYRARVGEDEAARRRGAIMAEQWGYQLAEQRKRLGFTQASRVMALVCAVTKASVTWPRRLSPSGPGRMRCRCRRR